MTDETGRPSLSISDTLLGLAKKVLEEPQYNLAVSGEKHEQAIGTADKMATDALKYIGDSLAQTLSQILANKEQLAVWSFLMESIKMRKLQLVRTHKQISGNDQPFLSREFQVTIQGNPKLGQPKRTKITLWINAGVDNKYPFSFSVFGILPTQDQFPKAISFLVLPKMIETKAEAMDHLIGLKRAPDFQSYIRT